MRALFLLLACGPVLATDPGLRARLHAQARAGAKVIPYSSGTRFDTSDALAIIDGGPADPGRVWLVYSGSSHPASTFGDTAGWNREHLWPNSLGIDDREPAYSDLHHLRACDVTVNAARGNKWFDTSSAAEGGVRIPAHAEAPLCTSDSNSWEPPASERGDIARALFYMDIRYEGDVAGEPDLQLVEAVGTINSAGTRMGRLSTLLRWNEQDPPDATERARDAAVASIQGNSNPFVADPALAGRIWMPSVRVESLVEGPRFTVEATDLPVVIEYATDPLGPWSRIVPAQEEDRTFARVRLAEPGD